MSTDKTDHLRDGRTNQKLRTRLALLHGARRLMEQGEQVSVTAAAKESGISVATAYRYFSDPDTLASEAVLDLDLARSGDLMAEVSEAMHGLEDVRERVLRVHQILFEFTRRMEMPYRLFVAKTLEAYVKAGGKSKGTTRGGRRVSMFEIATKPLREKFSDRQMKELIWSLSAATGMEVIIVLNYICHLSDKDIDLIAARNVLAILDSALADK